VIVRIRAIDIECSDPSRGVSPLENALHTRFPGTMILGGQQRVRVLSKVHGERQWVCGPRLRSWLAEWETGHTVKPGWFRMSRVKDGG